MLEIIRSLLLGCALVSLVLVGCSARAGSQFEEEQLKQEELLQRQQKVLERQQREKEDLERQMYYDQKYRGFKPSPRN